MGTDSFFAARNPWPSAHRCGEKGCLSPFLRNTLLLLLASLPLFAQPPVAPTDESTGPAQGENVSSYNILQSFETGYRFETVGGNAGMYRSTVNYGNGIRLLSSSLSVQSRDGHGKFFDQILLNTQGLGNDPYQFASLRVEKNRLYRYDLTWRSNAYFNPALTISGGEHLIDTVRNMQDQDLTLFPQSNFKFFLGYSRNTQSGPALSTIQLFDNRGDEYPLFANIRRQQNEYRVGGEAHVLGFRLNVLHGWEDFKEDTPLSLTQPSAGNNPNDFNQLNSFASAQPYHGTSPYWRVALFREGAKLWAANGRFTYVAGRRAFVTDELSNGLNASGTPLERQVLSFGNAQRPAATANLTVSLFPLTWATITNQTSFYNIRMVGDSYFVQYDNGSSFATVLPFEFLGIQTIANATDVQIQARPWLSFHLGYEYSDRRIRSVEGSNIVGLPPVDSTPIEQNNALNSGTFGIRLRPLKALTIRLDTEIGRADQPISPISDRNYQALNGRVEYKTRTLRFSAFAGSDYNTNSNSLTSYASHSRRYGVDGSWSGTPWFSVDLGYNRMHLDTLGGLAYFLGRTQVTGDQSYYVSNIHAGNLAARFNAGKRVDVSLGLSIVQDTGDGRATATSTPLTYSAQPAFIAAQTFPLRFLSPQARVSVKITEKIRWNAGFQHYGYREDFQTFENYRAQTGYTSLLWSF